MIVLGRSVLVIALGLAVYGAGVSALGAYRGRADMVASGRRAAYVLCGLAFLATAILEVAYARDDFSYALVAGNSSTATPLYYKLTAMWSSQAGSLLLWLTILSTLCAIALRTTRRRDLRLVGVAGAVMLLVAGFFALLMVGFSSPFERATPIPVEGNGLQPLLRYPLMAVHPIALYTGYAGFTIPFAFAVGALVTRRVDATWLVLTRRYALVAWAFLAAGLVFGARWSYAELGWGGYWGWDPVENAALLPWLTATAFLHSSIIQEKRGMLKVWNVSLVCATFVLALIGTFLVRSGILDSIHAFGASTLGIPFIVLIAVTIAASVALVVSRLDVLRSEHRLDSLLSREAIFLFNNLALVAMAFVILWGTFFPLISEAVSGERRALGPPWFDRYTVPVAIVLVLLTGIGPVMAWRRVTASWLRRAFAWPVMAALATLIALLADSDASKRPTALITFCLVAFAIAVVLQEFVRGTRARRQATGGPWPAALGGLVARNRRRYGGYVIHVGMAVLLLGVAASSSFGTASDRRLRPGQSARVGGYEFTYRRATSSLSNERISFGAVVDVRRDGRRIAVLRPSRGFYPRNDLANGTFGRFFDGEATSEIGLRASAAKDLWVAVSPSLGVLRAPLQEANRRFSGASPVAQALIVQALAQRYTQSASVATFRIIVRTGVSWIWIGAGLMGLGAMIALAPRRFPVRRLKPAIA